MGKEPARAHADEMRKMIDRYFTDYFTTIKLIQIDEVKVQKFLVYLKTGKKLSGGTVNHARNVAFVALRYAKRNRVIKHFDFEAVLRAGDKAAERGILERKEVETLFKAEWRDPRSRLITLIASQTGMRISEIRGLRVFNIHEDRINVDCSWSRRNGGFAPTKNREKRTIPILPELYAEISGFMKEYCIDNRLDNLIFSGDSQDKPYANEQIEKDFKKALRSIGITEEERKERGIVFHSWRHYCAKNLAEVTNRAIGMAILGHKTSRMFDHYASHVDKETFVKMSEAIAEGNKAVGRGKEPIRFSQQATC
jgi:integrase